MGTVTYARHIYARAMASFEHCMIPSSVVSFIVHLLLNGDTGIFEIASGTENFIKELAVVVKTHVLSDCPCSGQLFRHPRLEFGGVYQIRSERAPTPYQASYAMMRFLSAWCLSVLPKLQPPLFLIRQHISPRALFMQPRPCQIMRISGAPRNLLMCRA